MGTGGRTLCQLLNCVVKVGAEEAQVVIVGMG